MTVSVAAPPRSLTALLVRSALPLSPPPLRAPPPASSSLSLSLARGRRRGGAAPLPPRRQAERSTDGIGPGAVGGAALVPALKAAVDAENYDELTERSEEKFEKVKATRAADHTKVRDDVCARRSVLGLRTREDAAGCNTEDERPITILGRHFVVEGNRLFLPHTWQRGTASQGRCKPPGTDLTRTRLP